MSHLPASILVLGIALMLSVLSGCGNEQGYGKAGAGGAAPAAEKPRNDDQKVVEEEYNFGQVPVDSSNEHCFKITNTSNVPWTAKEAHVSCSCVVSSMSSKSIAPGATEEIVVKFTVGDGEGRFKQAVLLEFEEASAPLVRLGVSATVHHPLSCSRELIVLNPVRAGTREEQFVKVSNFSKDKWADLAVDNTAGWVDVDMRKNSSAANLREGDAPLQLWNVAVKIDGGRLSEGWNVATVGFHPKGNERLKANLVVRAFRTPAVSVEPSTVFCGIADRGNKLQRVLRFTFRDRFEVPALGDITARIANVPMLLRWRKDPEDAAALLLECTIQTSGDTLNGDLAVDFGKSRRLSIPVRGSFRDAVIHGKSPGKEKASKAGVH